MSGTAGKRTNVEVEAGAEEGGGADAPQKKAPRSSGGAAKAKAKGGTKASKGGVGTKPARKPKLLDTDPDELGDAGASSSAAGSYTKLYDYTLGPAGPACRRTAGPGARRRAGAGAGCDGLDDRGFWGCVDFYVLI